MKSLILAELIFIVLSIIGFGLKIGLIPWGTPLLIIGMLGLAIIYFARSTRPVLLNSQPQAAGDRFFVPAYKLSNILFSLSMLGVLLKAMLWNSGFLSLGAITLLIFVFWLAMQVLKGKVFFNKLLIKSVFIAAVALTFYQTPLATFINLYYRENPGFAKKFIEYRENPKNEIKKKNYIEARKKLLKKHVKK